MNSTRRINPISDDSIAYATFAWDSGPSGARIILLDAIKQGKLKEDMPFDEFNLFVQNFLQPEVITPQPAPTPKKKIPFLSIVGFFFLCFMCLVFYGFIKDTIVLPVLNSTAYDPTPHRTATPARPPTATHVFGTVVPITQNSDCIHWSQVTAKMEGRTVCVYGNVTDYQEKPSINSTYLYFGTQEQLFFVITDLYFRDFKDGECAMAEGIVQLNTYKTPYIKINELFYCE